VRVWDADRGVQIGSPLQGHTEVVRSVGLSPDGTRIVSGSDDNTVRVWDADAKVRTINDVQGKVSLQSNECYLVFSSHNGEHTTLHLLYCYKYSFPYNTVHDMHATLQSDTQNPISCHPIKFSSFPAHALHGSENLCFHDKQAFHQCVRLHEDGWIKGPHGQLLLWVPAGNRHPFYSPFTMLVMPRGGIELDFSQMAYGCKWQECFEPWQHYY